MSNLRDQQLAWLDHISRTANMTLTEIARASGLTPSTLTRFRQNNDMGHVLTARTVQKIEDATRVPAYEVRITPKIIAFSEEEAVPFEPANGNNPVEAALRSASKDTNHIQLWSLKTNSLAAVGYPSGMVVAVDERIQPRNGDAVCAQKFDFRRGTAETIFRVIRAPYLMTAYMDREPDAPEVVDNETIKVVGVIVGGFRLRH